LICADLHMPLICLQRQSGVLLFAWN